MPSDSPAVALLKRDPRVFWGKAIRVLIERGWRPPLPDEQIVEDLLRDMERESEPIDVEEFALTPMEARVAALIAQGMTAADIGAAIDIAPGTVKFHTANIYRKLGVKSRAEAMVLLLRGL